MTRKSRDVRRRPRAVAARVPAVRRSSGRQAAQGAAGSAATLRLPRRRSNARKEMSSYSVSTYIVSYTAGPRRTTIQQNRIVTPPVYVYTAHTAHTPYSRTAHTPYITIQHPSDFFLFLFQVQVYVQHTHIGKGQRAGTHEIPLGYLPHERARGQ